MNFKSIALAAALAGFALTSQAASIGVHGSYPGAGYVSALTAFGHTVVNVATANAASLSGLDVLVLARDANGNSDITAFVNGGGMLITEWTSTIYAMGLLGGAATDNYGTYSTNDTIAVTAAGLAAGLASYADSGATEFFHDFTNVGTGTVYARRGTNNNVAIVGGAYGSGFIWANGYDWADGGGNPTFTFLNSQIHARIDNGQVPEPTALALVGVALLGAGLARRRKA
jgi:hypothetical protein